MSPEIVALLGAVVTIIVRVWSAKRAKMLELELEESRDREIDLERRLHQANCQLARHGLAAECPLQRREEDECESESESESGCHR